MIQFSSSEAVERPVSALCLDVGEVLIDETRVWSVWAQLLGTTPFTLHAAMGAAIADGRPHTDALERLGGRDWLALEDDHEARYAGFALDDLYDDALPTLHALAQAGRRVVIAGNQPLRRAAQLRALELPVELVVTSEELGVDKPDPAFFAALAQRVGVEPPLLWYVGDRLDHDVTPAAAAGWRTCWIQRGPWARLAPPARVSPDLTIERLDQLPQALAAWEAHHHAVG